MSISIEEWESFDFLEVIEALLDVCMAREQDIKVLQEEIFNLKKQVIKLTPDNIDNSPSGQKNLTSLRPFSSDRSRGLMLKAR